MTSDQLLVKANTLGQEASKQTGVAFTPIKPAVQSGQPIDASLLGDAKPLVVPPPSVASTISSGLGGTADAMAKSTDSSISQSLKAEADARKQEAEQSKGLFQNLQDKYNAVVGSRQSEEEKAGLAEKATAVAKARAEARTASDNIIASRQAQQNELNALEGQGLGEVQLAQKQAEINRRYGKDQANLSLEALKTSSILNNVDFDYQTASSIVDRKIQNELEPLKILMEQAQTFYQDNKESFSKAEDRAFSQLVSEAKQKHDDEQSKLEKIGQIQLEAAKNGAPSSVIRAIGNAGSIEEAISATGGYAQSVTDRLKVSGGSTGLSPTTLAVIDNPNLINSLTPTLKGQVIAQLQQAGYDTTTLGAKPLSDTAIAAITQDKDAISALNELKTMITGNEQYLGPVSGFQALNPYSPAKILQAKIDLVRQKVGKALEGGVLRKEDEEKYKRILATVNDTPNLSVAKIDSLIGTLETSLDNYTTLQTGAGRSSNITGSLTKKGSSIEGKTTTGNSYTVTKE